MSTNIKLTFILMIIAVALMQNLRVDSASGSFLPGNFFSSQTQMINVASPAASTPATQQSVSKSEMIGDVELSHHIPSTFLVGEVFQFVGDVNASKLNTYLRTQSANTRVYDLNIVLTSKDSGEKITCTKKMFIQQTAFIHQCLFTTSGDYYMSIYIGNRQSTTPKVYKVVNAQDMPQKSIPSSTKPAKPQNLTLNMQANDLYVSWTPSAILTKIVFLQKFPYANRKQFIVSNDKGSFKIPYPEFRDFNKVATTIQISHADSSDLCASERSTDFSDPVSTEVNVTEHLFQEIKYPKVELSNEIKTMVGVNEQLRIEGTSIQELNEKALVVDPKNRIEENKMEVNTTYNSRKFRFRQRVNDEGVYIIEINHAEGYALVNTPVYAGSSYPLLPDFMDLHPLRDQNKHNEKPMSLNQMRNLVLKLINDKRRESGVGEVVLDQQLNGLAQLHATDMGVKGYISHTNLYGEDAGERAKKQGIYSPVGENIAVNDDLEYGRYRLDRSPNHLKNTINGIWTRVGVGIYKKYNGMYYFTEEYSCEDISKKPITPAVMTQIKSEIVKGLNSKSPIPILHNTGLSNDLQDWYNKNPDINSSIDSLKAFVSEKRLNNAKLVQFKVPYMLDFLSLVQKGGYLDYKGLNTVGIAINVSRGILSTLMILN